MAAPNSALSSALSAGRTDGASSGLDRLFATIDHPLLWPARYLDSSPALAALPLIFWLTDEFRPELVLTEGDATGVAHLAFCQATERLGLDTLCVTDAKAPEQAGDAPKRAARLGEESVPEEGFDLIAAELSESGGNLAHLAGRLSDSGALMLYGSGLGEALLAGAPAPDMQALIFGTDSPRVALWLAPGAPEAVAELAALPVESPERQAFNRFLDRQGEIHRLEFQARGAGARPDPAVQEAAPPPSRHAEDVERLLAKLIELEEDRQALRQGGPGPASDPVPETIPVAAAASPGPAERLQELEAEIALLQHRMRESDRDLKAIRASTSWRITAPIRAVVLALRRFRGR